LRWMAASAWLAATIKLTLLDLHQQPLSTLLPTPLKTRRLIISSALNR